VSSRFTLRRTLTALAMGAAAAASLVVTAPAAVADQPQTKLMRLLDECDKETFDVGLPGLCTVDAGSVTFDRFTEDLQRGGSGAWWINNRKETVDAGDTLHVVNQGGIAHSFTEVKTFGSGIVPPFNVAVNNAPTAVTVAGSPIGSNPADFGTIVGPGSAGLDVTPAKGVHQYQCMFHPWMRTVVTVR
jgi:plastocyanin